MLLSVGLPVLALELGVQGKHQAVDAVHQAWRKVCAELVELVAEIARVAAFEPVGDEELCQGLVANTHVILELGRDL